MLLCFAVATDTAGGTAVFGLVQSRATCPVPPQTMHRPLILTLACSNVHWFPFLQPVAETQFQHGFAPTCIGVVSLCGVKAGLPLPFDASYSLPLPLPF